MAGDALWTVGRDASGVRLDKFLADAARLGSRGGAAAALARGKIFLNGAEASRADAGSRLKTGDIVRCWMDRPGSARRPAGPIGAHDLQVVYEDDALVVLNKPAGLLAVPLERRADAASVFEDLKEYYRGRRRGRPLVVHRIDRDTSGLVVFARDARAQRLLKDQFRRREPVRIYWAVVYGHPQPEAGTWRDHLTWDESALVQKQTHPRDPRGKEAVSDYRVLERFATTALVEVRLRTGKRNQIRLQARLRGHTLVGEQRYTFGPDALRPIAFGRQALHAYRLAFRHPTTGAPLEFEAPLPADFSELLARLRRQR